MNLYIAILLALLLICASWIGYNYSGVMGLIYGGGIVLLFDALLMSLLMRKQKRK